MMNSTMTDWWVFANCDCLGCLMDARNRGDITEDEYNDIFDCQQASSKLQTAPCPNCHKPAYISMYEPDMMHCPSCGVYSFQEWGNLDDDWIGGEWRPMLQGATHFKGANNAQP